jgi:hypothetical protein
MALGRTRLMREQEEERKRKKEQRNRTDQYKGGERSRTSTLEKREKGAEQARETWNKAKKLTGDSLKFGGKLLSSLDLRDRIASEGEQFKAGKEFNQGLNLGLQMNPQTEAEKQINNNTNKIYNVAENTRAAGKWSGNIHSSARNSALRSKMRTQEQFQGPSAEMGAHQADMYAQEQANLARKQLEKMSKTPTTGKNQPGGGTGTVPKDKASNTPFPTAEIYNKKPNLGTEIFKPGGARPPGIGFKEGGKAMEKINKSKKGTGITNEQALAAFETFAKAIAANSKKDDDRFHTFNNKQFSYSPW